jgi:RNA polymerase sigma-70 factor (ECF subfamily)
MKSLAASIFQRASRAKTPPGDAAEDRRLLAAARGGDRRALELVTRRVSGSLYRFSRGFCRDPHDAEDVMQDVLVALVSSLGSFRGDASLSSWTYVVARNACARRRRRARHHALEDGNGEAMLAVPDPGAEPDRAAERHELREALEEAIAALPATLRDALVLRDVEGLPAAEVARLLDVGERAVKSRLHRARARLRDALAPHVAADAPRRHRGCPDLAPLFSRFLEGELDAGACARLEAHITKCAGCDALCSSLRAALGACAAWPRARLPEHVRRAVRAALRCALAERGSATASRLNPAIPRR